MIMDQQCQLLNDLFSKLFVGNLVQGFKQALKEVFISFLHLLYHLLTREAENAAPHHERKSIHSDSFMNS